MKFGLTAQQRSLLHFIQSYIESNGIPPSFDEMKQAMGLASKSGVHRIIVALEERGHIVRKEHRARAMRVSDSPTIDTADALKVVLVRCRMTKETAREISRLWSAEVNQ